MKAELDIQTPLPTTASEGDEAWILDAELANLTCRKIDAFYNIQAELPLKITKSDAGFLITLEQ